MSLATRGLGAKSGLVASFGFGRVLAAVGEYVVVYFSAISRRWDTTARSRVWGDLAMDRLWQWGAWTRDWSHSVRSRGWVFFDNRSWKRSRLRAWFSDPNRPWNRSNDGT